PAAALCARELAQKAAFFCVDLANLAQYTHAADRTQADVQPYFSVTSQAVQQLVGMVLEAAKKANIPMVLCCDNAAQPSMVESYARLGVRCFSMAAGDILPAKEYLMGMSLQ
ncbi:MAG: putative PEP-binding protein, partial [Ruthenibacterium sp.]